MAKYDVYGIGNALVDMEYEVTTADLEALSLTKGVMTLVDQEQQTKMMQHLAAYPHHRSSGGSAANSMIAICQFGGTSFYSCKVASDELGHFYTSDLCAGGVDTNHQRTETEPGHTGRCVVLVTPDSDRTLCTFLGISSELSADDLVENALLDSDYFYMEGYLVTAPAARQACLTGKHLAETARVKTAISLSDPNIVRFFKDGLLEMIGSGVDLLFANEDEACGLAQTNDPQHAVDYLKTLSREFVITRGAKGALVWDGRDLLTIDPIPVAAVDTVGAGDLFAGAFLYGRARGWDHRQAGALASSAAADLVTRLGPRLPPAEAKAILQRFL
ncbi:MAG: adenosine kinase [Candidatus Competibacter denitrificans]